MTIIIILLITIFLLLSFSSIIHSQWTCIEWDSLYRDLPNRQVKVKVSQTLIKFLYLTTEIILKIHRNLFVIKHVITGTQTQPYTHSLMPMLIALYLYL